MTPKPDQVEEIAVTDVGCCSCNCEVPLDEAVVPEATDYLVYFCGVRCYATWRAAAVAASLLSSNDDIDGKFRQGAHGSS